MTARVCRTAIPVLICLAAVAATPSSTDAQTTVPGTVQAEDFNTGAAGVAYYDTTPGNSGGQYRPTDVDIEATDDLDGGHNIGWIFAGEWLDYAVNVAAAGSYDIDVRVASSGAGGRFHIEVNGVDRTGPLTIPDTGGWQNWTTIRRTGVSLAAGPQTWRIVMDTNGASGALGNINYIRATRLAGGSGPTPFSGTLMALPGVVEAEDFDNGGEGVAYHDLSAGNDGGHYRSVGVDIEAASDTGGGYSLGYIFAGEWLTYGVNVAAAGTYAIEARVASNGSGGTFHIEVNGVDRTGPFTVPNTGGWQNWTTIRKTGLALSAGPQTWRLVMDTNGPTTAVGNINYIRVSASSGGAGPTPFSGTPSALPGTIQLEAFDNGGEGVAYHDLSAANSGGEYRATAVDIEQTSDAGGGYNLGWAFAGEWLTYSVNVTAAGTYDIEARVASAGAGGTFHIEVNGIDRTGPFTVPNTGGWQTWTTIRKSGLSLAAGPQIWRVIMDTNGPTTAVGNFNYIRVPGAAANQPPAAAITSPLNGATYSAPATITLNAVASDADGTVSRVDFYAGSLLIGSDLTSPYSATWSNIAAGAYSLTAVAVDNNGATTTSAAVSATVDTPPASGTTTLVFNASADHATGVTSYVVAIRRAGDAITAMPLATSNVGKPTPSNYEISCDISDIVNPLPAGSYYAVVTASGPAGSSASAPSPAFTK